MTPQEVAVGPDHPHFGVPSWVFYGGPVYVRDMNKSSVTLPWRVYPVVDLINDNYGHGILIRFGGLDGAIDWRDLP